MQVGKTPTVLTSMSQPFNTGPLPDQNGVYARFEIVVNKTMYDYILSNALYSKAGQRAFTGPVNFQCGVLGGLEGAILVKAAWKVIDPSEKSRFHSTQALVYSPASTSPAYPASCQKQTVGLVGMHIVHKTNSAVQWVWSTFEHIDNAPTEADVAGGKLQAKYNFYNPQCSAADCPPNQAPPRPWDPTKKSAFRAGRFVQGQRVRAGERGRQKRRRSETARRRECAVGLEELSADQHAVADGDRPVRDHAGQSRRNTGAQLPRQHHARDLRPGDDAARLFELHDVPQQRHDDDAGAVGLHLHPATRAVNDRRCDADRVRDETRRRNGDVHVQRR
jgi:hypothetical protein